MIMGIIDAAHASVLCMRPRDSSGHGKLVETNLENEPWPLDTAGILSRMYFIWASPLVEVGIRRPLQLSDIWKIGPKEECCAAGVEVQALWDAEVAAVGPDKASFARVAWRRIRYDMAITFSLKMGWLAFAMLGNSFLLGRLINFFGSDEPLYHGLLYALGFSLCEAMRSLFVNQHWLVAVMAGVRLRAGIRTVVFHKLTRLRGSGLPPSTAVNLLLSDAGRMLEACNYLEFIASTPITVAVTLGVMVWTIGPSAIAGFVILALFSPLQAQIGQWLGTLRRSTVKITDERVRLVSEMLSGIRLLKLYGYEGAFGDALAAVRAQEVVMLARAASVRAINSVAVFSLPVLVTLGVFAAVTLSGGQLQPSAAFVVLALFNVARFPLGVLPQATRQASEALVAAKRIKAFLLQPEQVKEDAPVVLPPVGLSGIAEIEELKKRTGSEDIPSPSTALFARGLSCTWEGVIAPDSAVTKGAGGKATANSAGNGTVADANTVAVSIGAVEGSPASPPPVKAPASPGVYGIDLDIQVGQCIAVVGAVGCGKSSLLSALLGHMRRVEGGAAVRGKVAFSGQTPWIATGSIRDNILLGRAGEFHEDAYDRAVYACALGTDLAVLPAGDATEIGERGINLSGGQKARLSLARALYADADVYLLDDPLAAVDASTSSHLWQHAIQGQLLGRGKTVILVTHASHILPDVHRVLVLEAGRVIADGRYSDLREAGVDMRVRTHAKVEGMLDAAPIQSKERSIPAIVPLSTVTPAFSSPSATAAPGSAPVARVPTVRAGAPAGVLTVVEDRTLGAVSGGTFFAYLRAAGGLYTGILLLAVLLAGKGSRQVSDWYLSVWTTESARAIGVGNPLNQVEANTFLWKYSLTVVGIILATLLQGLLFATITLAASRRLHDSVATSILRAKLSWFDTQPTGRILNRFTGDVDTVDTALPATLETCLDFVTACALSVVLIAAVFPYFLIALAPLLIIFVFITAIFRRVARELKRLDSMARGPLVSSVSSTAAGLASLRCYGVLPTHAKTYYKHVDANTRTYLGLYIANRWVAIRVDWVTTATAGCTALLAVMSRSALTPALAGLTMSYALSLAGVLQYCMRLTTETEASFTSVERLQHYAADLPPEEELGPGKSRITDAEATAALEGVEAAYGLGTGHMPDPASNSKAGKGEESHAYFSGWRPGGANWSPALLERGWPTRGSVQFKHVSVRYRSGLPLVLKDVSFTVQPGWLVGVVGRTGSGKSTLAMTLLRALEPEGEEEREEARSQVGTAGSILVDGVDIARVSLYQLRRGVSVIPQDPTLFRGTLATNLDTFAQHDEAALWEAIGAAGLTSWVQGLPGGLQYVVMEGGGNLSVGQRQLVCLARALLRKSRLIILDEATANLDAATDAAIQSAVRTFARARGATVLLVAHRLHTVLDCDRVLGLDAGRAIEYDAPAALLGLADRCEEQQRTAQTGEGTDDSAGPSNAGQGLLARLVEETGKASAEGLKAQALAAYMNTIEKAAAVAR